MYNGIQKIEEIIEDIEANILHALDYDRMAAKMSLSTYEFRRIFSFVIGCPISEYVRKRKLSLAALDIVNADKVDLAKISEKYGYSNQSAFSRAFAEHHGFSPTVCLTQNVEINVFTRPKFTFEVSGAETVLIKILKTDRFYLSGFQGLSDATDSCCCENVWNAFYESGAETAFSGDAVYAAYWNENGQVKCCIGEPGGNGEEIPATRWACFAMDTTDDDAVNAEYARILYERLPSVNLKRNVGMPTVEVFPVDMSKDGFEWEIRIPIE